MINDYIILTSKECNNVAPEGYEEITVEDFLKRENASEEEKKEFLNKYFAVNIHMLISKETLPILYELIDDVNRDDRLSGLNAIVFLSLKKKGRGESFNSVSQEEFKNIIDICFEKNIKFGFDSCSAHKFLNCIKGTDRESLSIYCEPCESTRMSFYINAHGKGFPCSFTEGTDKWEEGLDVLNCNDFITDIWNHPKTHVFRELSILNNYHCIIYDI